MAKVKGSSSTVKKSKAPAKQRFELFHWVENNGDGSASVRYTITREAAEKKEEKAVEDGGDGWGESCVGSCTLEFEDGKLYLIGTRFEYNEKTGKGKTVEFRNDLKQV